MWAAEHQFHREPFPESHEIICGLLYCHINCSNKAFPHSIVPVSMTKNFAVVYACKIPNCVLTWSLCSINENKF